MSAAGSRARWGVPLALAAVAASLIALSVWRRPPRLPRDPDHPPAQAVEHCLSCHGPGRPQARPPSHPRNDQCLECHEAAGPLSGSKAGG